MQNTITAKIVRIGNSQGIRIPKILLEQLGIKEMVELSVVEGALQVRPRNNPREGWDEDFAAMAANGDDALLFPDDMTTVFDEEEWEW